MWQLGLLSTKVTIHKRLLAPLVVALAASVLLLGWAAGSPAAAPGRADPDETGVSDSVQAQVVRAPVQLTDNVGVSEGVYFGSFNGDPFIEADVAISEVVQLSVSRAPVQLTDTIQLIDGPFITPLPGPVVVVIDSRHVAESVDFSVVRAASPSVQFSAATYSVAENSGSATIIVTRTGDSAGEATVGYATGDGTATAGSDYRATSGNITFADGDTTDQTFTIPIFDDPLVEGNETVNLILGNPIGNATLGSPNTAVLTITDDDLGDVNEDGFVDLLDVLLLVANFGPPPFDERRADVNGDGMVDVLDLAMVARNLGRTAPKPLRTLRVERAFPNLTFEKLTNLVQPDDGQDHIFVTEQLGRIRLFPNDQETTQKGTFLDIRGRVSDQNPEEGLLGLAIDPDYRNNGYFYVYYSASSPRRSVVSRFSVSQNDPNVADPDSELIIMEIPQPYGNHNGGQIAVGPEGYLYIGLGDGGGSGDSDRNGQNRGTFLGSLLRIDVSGTSGGRNYRIPPDNPFVGVSGAREEIWAYGLRNPWRFSFDEETGLLWLADVGQNLWEEVDLIHQGGNYGWKIMEGNHCFSPSSGCDQTGLELPIVEYSHADGCSITGGYVYRGRGLPSLLGAYVYADFCSGKIWGLRYDGQAVTEHMLLVDSNLFITSLGTDLAGNLYLLSRNLGIYRLAPKELTGGLLATFEVAGEPFNVWVTSPDTIQQILALQQGTVLRIFQ